MPLQKVAFLPVIIALALSSACSRASAAKDLPLDATVDIERTDREVVAVRVHQRTPSAPSAPEWSTLSLRTEPYPQSLRTERSRFLPTRCSRWS